MNEDQNSTVGPGPEDPADRGSDASSPAHEEGVETAPDSGRLEAAPGDAATPAPRDWGRIALIAGFALLLLMLLWQTVAVSRAHASKQEALQKAEQAKVAALDGAKEASSLHTATVLAAGLHQLFLLRSQYPDVSDRTFQAVCSELAATGKYDLIVITDSNGRVLASSDLTQVGTNVGSPIGSHPAAEKVEGRWQVKAAILSQDATLGGVLLRFN